MAKVRRGSWTEVEDRIIARAVEEGVLKWSEIGKRLPSQKTGKQCRERWFNHLDPTLKKSPWTTEEDAALVDAQNELGNSWTRIAHELDGRSENEVKNRWYSAPMRKLVKSKKGKRPHEGEGTAGIAPRADTRAKRSRMLGDLTTLTETEMSFSSSSSTGPEDLSQFSPEELLTPPLTLPMNTSHTSHSQMDMDESESPMRMSGMSMSNMSCMSEDRSPPMSILDGMSLEPSVTWQYPLQGGLGYANQFPLEIGGLVRPSRTPSELSITDHLEALLQNFSIPNSPLKSNESSPREP